MNKYRLAGLFLIAIIVMFCGPEAHCYLARDIFSYTAYDYADGSYSKIYENAAIVPLTENTEFLLKLYREDQATRNNSIVRLGSIFLLSQYDYAEGTYGSGLSSDGIRTHYFALEINAERPLYMAGGGFRFVSYPDYHFLILMATLKYSLSERASLWGKYFVSIDADNLISNSIWCEGEYQVFEKIKAKAGFTGGGRSYDIVFGKDGGGDFYSWLVGISYEISRDTRIKYVYESLVRESINYDTKNILYIDFKIAP